jgi:cytoskeletal protein CcmA (bactofilin family)
MGATYTRQSSSGIVDGGVIEATDLNNEFDQLLAAFAVSSGHTHDGTAAEGGPITKLLGTAITIGDGTSGTDIAVTFDGESADGVLTWMEDEDYFKFSDEVLMNSTEKLLFGDTGTYIHQSADGVLDLVSDSEIEINATTIDINGAVDISGNATVGGDLTVTGDDITMGTNTNTAIMVADGTNFNPVVPSGDVGLTNAGVFSIASGVIVNADVNSSAAIADSKLATISTADKVAGGAIQIDSGTDGTSITLADSDKFLVDDGGTTKYINASQLNTYTSASVAADDLGTGDAAVTLATSSGNITIDAQAGDADIIFKGTDSSSDITALTLDMSEAGAATFNDKIVATELDISGDVDVDGTLEADAITIDGTTLAETIADTVGAMVGSNTETGITVTYEDGDNTLDFALGAAQTTITSLLATDIKIGEDDQTKIDFETADTINFYAGNEKQLILTDGALTPGADNILDLGSSGVEFKDGYFDGTVTADAFAGPLTGDVTGNVSGTAATVTTAAQSNITSLGTLTTLTVDNIITNGTTIGHTSDTDLLTLTSGVLTVAGEVSMTTLDIGGTNVTSTAAELNYCDGVTSNIQTQLDGLDATPLAIALG